MHTRFRDPFSALSHFAGAAAALLGLAALLARPQPGPAWTLSLLVYGLSLCGLFLASATYHTVRARADVWRKIDHAAIYLLIAGTYTPFCANAFTGFWQWGFLAIVWGLALVGIVAKLFMIHAPRWITAGIYLLMGWLSVFAVGEMLATLPAAAIAWLVAGGLLYTLGAVIYITRRVDLWPGVFGFHEVWHLFVLFGAAAHFAAVASIV